MPTDWRAVARDAARRAGINPDLFLRQIDQESGFNPSARSGAGAVGIAQIVPQYHPDVDPTDPAASLRYAANWMARLLQQYGGDWSKALAHYNGGGGAVQQMASGRPYDETRQYLTSILGGLGPRTAEAAEMPAGEQGGTTVDPQPRAASPQQALFDQIIAAKGDPTGVKVVDPTVKGEARFGRGATDVPNPTPTYELTFADGTHLLARTSASGALELLGGTAQVATARAAAAPTKVPGSIIGGQTPNEQFIVTVNPDGTINKQPNPNYVAPTPAKPAGPRTVPTQANEQFIVRENPDGTISHEPNPNYVAPKPGRTTHTVGGRAFTLDDNGNVIGSVDLRSPQQVQKEGQDLTKGALDIRAAEQKLLPEQQRVLQGHIDTVKYVQGMLERGEIDASQADAYVNLSKSAAEAALRGTTPFDEMKEQRSATQANQRMGIDLVNQRLSSGASMANNLMSGALGPNIMLRPGQTSLGIDPLAGLMPLLNELQGGAEVAPFAKGLLMGGQQPPPRTGPLPAGL